MRDLFFVHYSEERKDKLDQKIKELRGGAVQYALKARRSGYYTCCDSTHIFLLQMEVWKYGVTTKKDQTRRYSLKYLNESDLLFEEQFKGTLEDCLIEEQKKIFHYALLPENLKRKVILIRPPGNKIDH